MNNVRPSNYAVKSTSLKGVVKDVSTSSRTVTGFFNTYNYLDSDGDVIMPGAAKKSIKERGCTSNATAKIKHALNHDLTQLPGKLITLDERTVDGMTGIYFESQLADTTLGNDTLKNYLAGIYDNHSIGFNYDQYDFVERVGHGNSKQWDNIMSALVNPDDAADMDCIMVIRSIKLWEGSTVAFGANSLTPFLGMAKSMTKESVLFEIKNRIEKLETTLRNGSQSDEMMQSVEVQSLQLKQMIDDLDSYIVIGKKDEIKKAKKEEVEKPKMITLGDFKLEL